MTIELSSQLIFAGAILALMCVVASIVSRRLGAPLLLVFLLLGMLAGEDGPGGIIFDDVTLAFFLGNLALAIIILDGGLGTRRDTFRVSLAPALSLATVGVLVTAVLAGSAAYWIMDLPVGEALLIGAIVGSTDAAAVFGLLRSADLDLKERTGATLEIESGTNDPMAIFLTVALVQFLTFNETAPGVALVREFVQQIGFGLAFGFIGGMLLVYLIRRLPLPVSLVPLFVFAGALSIFSLTNLGGGSGFLAIYIVGVIVGNLSLPYSSDIHRFHDGMAWLSQIGMFLMLGLLITPSHLPPIILPAIAIALVLIFVARPVAVLVALLPFHFPWREQVFIGWCGLRGAVPIILALFPSLAGLSHTETFFELVFFVVLISLVLQGWTIAPLAKWLGIEIPARIREPEHLIFGFPAERDKALHIYDAVPGCRGIGMYTNQMPLSSGAQLLGIIRAGMAIETSTPQEIRSYDKVMVWAPPGVTRAFSALFAPEKSAQSSSPVAFFGEFIIAPNAALRDLAELYGFDVPDEYRQDTVSEYVNKKFHHKPVVGDSVALGQVHFVVRYMEGDVIRSIGLKL